MNIINSLYFFTTLVLILINKSKTAGFTSSGMIFLWLDWFITPGEKIIDKFESLGKIISLTCVISTLIDSLINLLNRLRQTLFPFFDDTATAYFKLGLFLCKVKR